ncbi:hypothetical protein Ciccas_003821 [Cichlidogyrus casuarinus]|uniref:Laminin EGF-like domain-containing protein n=1 Tax=Cichlidogyrus casuarinus TaxID=1844966 RepID=A0ABD2QDA8_9PLAT
MSKCLCFEKGSKSTDCDSRTGVCQCQPNYTGEYCDACLEGYGDIAAGCPPCSCDGKGTRLDVREKCDRVTGECKCLPGVGGKRCDECRPGYYGMTSRQGCTRKLLASNDFVFKSVNAKMEPPQRKFATRIPANAFAEKGAIFPVTSVMNAS